jgi:hypothetical protein
MGAEIKKIRPALVLQNGIAIRHRLRRTRDPGGRSAG